MICHKYKCIFIHIPKNAGTTIINSFDKKWGDPDTSFLLSGPHSPKEHWIDLAIKYKDYFIFSVIRNPWDRFISGWKYCEGTKNKSFDEILFNLPNHGHDNIHITRTQMSTISVENKIIPNYLIRYENLQEDYNMLCSIIGKPKRLLEWHNKTEHSSYKDFFKTSSHKNEFYKHYKEDIETFQYTF